MMLEIADCDLKGSGRGGTITKVTDRGREQGVEMVPLPAIQKRILVVRERHVMSDEDLAELYGVETRRLVEQVKRNIERFPPDFMVQLSKEEASALRSQSATSTGWRPPLRPLRLHRRGCGDALRRTATPDGGDGQHRHRAGLR